jgi:hypothetical protein
MTVFTWTIPKIDRLTSNGFVIAVNYNVLAVDGEHSVSTYGLVNYAHQPDQNYIPYADLTEADVISWVQNSLGKDDVEATLQTQINVLKAPVIASGIPWSN